MYDIGIIKPADQFALIYIRVYVYHCDCFATDPNVVARYAKLATATMCCNGLWEMVQIQKSYS